MRSFITFNEVQAELDTIAESYLPDELDIMEVQADAVLAELLAWSAGEGE